MDRMGKKVLDGGISFEVEKEYELYKDEEVECIL